MAVKPVTCEQERLADAARHGGVIFRVGPAGGGEPDKLQHVSVRRFVRLPWLRSGQL